MFFRDRFDRIRTLSVLIKLKLIKIKKKFDGLTIFLDFQKKWPFLATFGKIALSQPKRIQIKKKKVPLESAKPKLQNKTKKSYF